MSKPVELGVNEVAKRIHLRLRRYLEAQYHIRNSALIEERRMLLEEPGGIAQRPFIEVTPSYALAGSFSGLKAPKAVTGLLQELVGWKPGIGVYPPYRHQADALEHFFAKEAESDRTELTATLPAVERPRDELASTPSNQAAPAATAVPAATADAATPDAGAASTPPSSPTGVVIHRLAFGGNLPPASSPKSGPPSRGILGQSQRPPIRGSANKKHKRR